ncbi:Hypothetical protein CGLY_16720 (plasmid) [Corynebacterium glyciniphilum AJ 3170]|uniref:Uncharacterized protein n=1 Tax=Corynebacterium glyciniphilum AJ 3170 TaxID=1404245 RepID=X5DYQ0_9CORY|nr:Hypothetical protein CGLY_16720 [Corynebacterium glyciniphilum AJ 3170]
MGAGTGEHAETPLKRLVTSGGRDGITLRLYLALLWKCSASPYDVEIPARLWAELLGLEPPVETYSRRVNGAVKRLEDANLISVDRRRGKPSVVTLLDESGDGSPYRPPRGSKDPLDRWVRVPIELWQGDSFYQLGTPGLAMLLAILAERNKPNEPMWWSISQFQRRIGLAPTTRARGVKQLREAGLLTAERKRLPSVPGSFANDPVRQTYLLHLGEVATRRRRKRAVDGKGKGSASAGR